MILLMDVWNHKTELLKQSLEKAGYVFESICVLYDGNLPDDVRSPYRYFIENGAGTETGTPLFFDELVVPENWEIRGTNTSGKVLDYEKERARIFYTDPKHRRHIKIVDWLDENGNVRFSDHYDRFGYRIAQTIVSAGKIILKNWFDRDGKEVLTENFVTGTILLRDVDGLHLFVDKTEFVLYYLQREEYETDSVYYTSLSTPYYVARRLEEGRGGHKTEGTKKVLSGMPEEDEESKNILFWQEPIRDTIPGNMLALFNGNKNTIIAVQTRDDYEKLRKKIQDPGRFGKGIKDPARADRMLRPVGFIYPYARIDKEEKLTGSLMKPEFQEMEEKQQKSVLTVTNSDHLESLEGLVTALPEVRFDVAALTEMSEKLIALERYPNVHLHPACSEEEVYHLFEKTDGYLDINYGDEVMDSVYQAFLHQIPVLAFDSTAHNRNYTAVRSVMPSANGTGRMIAAIQRALFDKDTRNRMIREQKTIAMDETKETFRKALEGDTQ